MSTTIERRVRQLEATAGGGNRCPECGGNGPDDRPPSIVFVDPDKAPPDVWCSECGSLYRA
jgi:DNA-directed RNA polymerase subunit RPC12/RpoP